MGGGRRGVTMGAMTMFVMVRRARWRHGRPALDPDTGASTDSRLTRRATSCAGPASAPAISSSTSAPATVSLTAALVEAGARVVAVELHPARARRAPRPVRRGTGDGRARRRRHRAPAPTTVPRRRQPAVVVRRGGPVAPAAVARRSSVPISCSPAGSCADGRRRRRGSPPVRRCGPSRSPRRRRPAARSPSSTAGADGTVRPMATRAGPAVRLRHAPAGPPALAVPRAVRRRPPAGRRPRPPLRLGLRVAGRHVRRRPGDACRARSSTSMPTGSTRRSRLLDEVEASATDLLVAHRGDDDRRPRGVGVPRARRAAA